MSRRCLAKEKRTWRLFLFGSERLCAYAYTAKDWAIDELLSAP